MWLGWPTPRWVEHQVGVVRQFVGVCPPSLSSPSFPLPPSFLLPLSLLQKVREIMAAVTIPVMAKCRIGHFAEAQILESLGVDFIDESEGERSG